MGQEAARRSNPGRKMADCAGHQERERLGDVSVMGSLRIYSIAGGLVESIRHASSPRPRTGRITSALTQRNGGA
jgi:hypothetical protein